MHTDNDQTDRAGIYSYPSLQAYEANRPDIFTVTEGDGLVRFTSFSAALFAEDTIQFGPHATLVAGGRYYFQNAYHNRPTHLSPRAELAISFGKQSHSVVRLGAGTFFDRLLTTNLAQLLQFNGVRLRRYVETDPPAMVTTANIPPSYLQIAPNATTSYVAQWSVALEQQLAKKVTFSIQGTMNAGIDQLRMLDVNAPASPSYTSLPNSALGQILSSESEGHSNSRSLDVMLKVAVVDGMTHQLRYRLAKSFSDTDGFSFIPANSNAPEADASYASYDQRQNLSRLSTWPLPGKITLGTVVEAGSGLPYSELLSLDANRDGVPNDRPAGIARNSLRGASDVALDVRLGRDFALRSSNDASILAISLSAFNATNHTNYTTYQGVLSSPTFRQPLTAGSPRQLQLNAALNF